MVDGMKVAHQLITRRCPSVLTIITVFLNMEEEDGRVSIRVV